MRIYKGEVGVDLTVEAFLDILEEDALDEIVDMVMDLEATGSIKEFKGDLDGDIIYLGQVNLDDLDNDLSALFENMESNMEFYDAFSEEEMVSMFMDDPYAIPYFDLEEELMDNFLLSNEDIRVKRIVKRFSHINDAS